MSGIRQVLWAVLSVHPQFPSAGKSAGVQLDGVLSPRRMKLADSQHGFADWTGGVTNGD